MTYNKKQHDLTIDQLLDKAQQTDYYKSIHDINAKELVAFLCKVDILFKEKGLETGEILRYAKDSYPSPVWAANLFYALNTLLDSDEQGVILAKERVRIQEEYDKKEKELFEENEKQREILNESWKKLKQYERTLGEINNKKGE